MLTTEECVQAAEEGTEALDGLLRPPDEVAGQWPRIELGSREADLLLCGNQVQLPAGAPAGLLRLYTDGGRFLGMGEAMGDGRLLPRRLLAHESGASGSGFPGARLSL